jgi:signal transduction histidine kinase
LTRLKIRTRLVVALAIPMLALGALGARYLSTINDLKVDGSLYDQVTGPGDVESDVARLSENQSRALIDAQQILTENEQAGIDGLVADLRIRHEQYDEAADAWAEGPLADQPALAEMLTTAYAPSVELYRVVDEELVPAIEADDQDAVDSAVHAVERAYAKHRAAADGVIEEARDAAATSEEAANARLDDSLRQDQLVAGALALLALLLGVVTVRSITRPLHRLEHDLPAIAEELRDMDLTVEQPEVHQLEVETHDELGHATQAFNSVVATSVDLAVEQVRVRENLTETLQHLGRRNQNLLRRMMSIITDLERGERDADALQELFRLDHIATRMRRNAESLLVLAGSEQTRRWSEPVAVVDVVRSAASEIEDYDRVDLANLEPVVVQGTVAADISHLLAELLENATLYSPPETRVAVVGRRVPEGYQLAVVDQGLGLDAESLERANARIRDAASTPSALTDSKLLGLNVVGRLADRHSTRVQLTPHPAGGLAAVVLLPRAVVAMPPTSAGIITEPAGPLPATAAPAPASVPAPALAPRPSTVTVPAAVPAPPTLVNGNGNGNGHAAPVAPAVVARLEPDEAGAPGLRRRVRHEADRTATAAPEVVHGPARTADEVRSSWAALAQGVEQARTENHHDPDTTEPATDTAQEGFAP